MLVSGQFTICDVCRLVDFDATKKLCSHCGMCDAWICEADLMRWDRRFQAWRRRKQEAGYKGLPNYDEVAGGRS